MSLRRGVARDHSPMNEQPGSTRTLRTRAGLEVTIGPLADRDLDQLFVIFSDVVARRDGYPHRPPLTRDVFEQTWVHPVTMVVGCYGAGVLVGAYYLKPNNVGFATHIANAGYVTAREHRRQGIGRRLVEDSIWRAAALGFDAIQFNLVFASNPARVLYEELGWQVIGRIPDAVEGSDALIYWRSLADVLSAGPSTEQDAKPT